MTYYFIVSDVSHTMAVQKLSDENYEEIDWEYLHFLDEEEKKRLAANPKELKFFRAAMIAGGIALGCLALQELHKRMKEGKNDEVFDT